MNETKHLEEIAHITGRPYNVILFNNDHHSMDEVSAQIQKAINCTPDRAFEIMLEAHTHGRAIVITCHQEKAEHVAAILEEIKLGVKVEPA